MHRLGRILTHPAALGICAGAMEALFLALRMQGDLRFRVPESAALLLLTSTFYLVAVYGVLAAGGEGRVGGTGRGRVFLIAGAALVFRLTVWPIAPALSDDVFRYRWEGHLQAEGGNPYQSKPNDPEWDRLRDETWPRVGGKDVKAGYGPLWELIEHAVYRLAALGTADPERQASWFKAPAALFDLSTIGALAGLLAARRRPPGLLLIYAWSPLGIIEFWGSGHNDAVAVFFVVLGLWLAAGARWWPAFASLSLAACAKLWPLILFPVFVGWNGRRPLRWKEWTIFLPIAAALAAPYWSNVEENARVMSGFVGGWRNNDSLYGLLLWVAGDQYPAKYAAFAIIIATAAGVTLARWRLERACLAVIAVMLMVSANCHPWYLTWLVPLLALTPVPALFLWTALMPLAYRVVIAWALLAEWEGSTPWRWWIYLPVYGLLAGTWCWRRRVVGGR